MSGNDLLAKAQAHEVLSMIGVAENQAMATDGPVPADHEVMTREELIQFFRLSWQVAKWVTED